MGPRQRGAARHKKPGSQKGSPWSQKQSNSSIKVQDLHPSLRHRALLSDWQDVSDSNSPRNGFSMSQEARNTERHTNAWGNTRLREQGITFVSAGNLTREEPEVALNKNEKSTEEDTPRDDTPASPEDQPEPFSTTQLTDTLGKATISDTVRDDTNIVSKIEAAPQRRMSVSSQSSEEIIFSGRLNPVSKPRPIQIPIRSVQAPSSAPKSQVTKRIVEQVTDSAHRASPDISSISEPFYSKTISKRNPLLDRRGRPRIRHSISDEQEAIMQDYIANMDVDDDDDDDDDDEHDELDLSGRGNEHFRFYDGSAEANVKVQTKTQPDVLRSPRAVDQAADWDSADLDDFDDLSTTDDEVGLISQVLRHRTRTTGPQYLVTAVGQGASDAKWVLGRNLRTPSAVEEIRIYEEIRLMKVQETSGDTDESESDEDVLGDLINEIESEDDENERIMKRTERMTDEQIARALAKQEELGLGSDELLLFDGQDEDDDDFADEPDFVSFSMKHHVSNRGKSKRNRRQRDSFPPAEAFADALDQDPYGAFDIMDFDRPSLRPRRKGRKADLPFELGVEDPELAEQLRSAWNKDRDKKASRKVEKQAERESLLLEASERNNPGTIKAEIRQFLVQESDVLKLAPMDSATRASVHRLAKALRLHSRSEGKEGHGFGRFPVLSKTGKTPFYTIDTIWEIDALMNTRKFFPKSSGGSYRGLNAPRNPAVTRARRGGGGVMSGATYSNGDVVGGSAPEIGVENKGRAMLEKMGWSSGMGIGAVGNEGGIDVIKHVVKTTKAGLG